VAFLFTLDQQVCLLRKAKECVSIGVAVKNQNTPFVRFTQIGDLI